MTVTQRTWLGKEMSEALSRQRYAQQSTGESPRSTRNAAAICAALTRVVLVQLRHERPNADSGNLDKVSGVDLRRGKDIPSLSMFLYRRRQSPTLQAKRRGSVSNSTCCRRSPSMICTSDLSFLFITLFCLSFRAASERSEPVSVSSLGGDGPLTRRDLSAGTGGEVRAGPKPEGFGPPTDVTT
jgi:hypothetical protein